jgi:DNA-binding protein Fis
MAAILLIEDEYDLKGLIKKIIPKTQLKVLRDHPEEHPGPTSALEESKKADPNEVLGEVLRGVLKAEVSTGNEDHIHESVLGKVERALIGMVLEEEHGNQVRAAKRLGINRNTLRKKMKDLQITTRVITN